MTAQQRKVDLENLRAPAEGLLVTHFLIVRNVARSRAFYADVLGGQVVLEENPCIVKLANSWSRSTVRPRYAATCGTPMAI